MSQLFGVDIAEQLQECKLASGKPANNGYYRKSYKNKNYLAHRLAYILVYGEPPINYEIHHLCHNRQCIEPTHLVAMTKAEHRLQEIKERGLTGVAKINATKTVAKCGHSFDKLTIKQRLCSACSTAYKTEWMRQKRKDPEFRNKINTRRREYRLLTKGL